MPDRTRTTYRRADGELIADEYDYTSDLDWFGDEDELIELIEEEWVLVRSRTVWAGPTTQVCPMCEGEGFTPIPDPGDFEGDLVEIVCPTCDGDGTVPLPAPSEWEA